MKNMEKPITIVAFIYVEEGVKDSSKKDKVRRKSARERGMKFKLVQRRLC